MAKKQRGMANFARTRYLQAGRVGSSRLRRNNDSVAARRSGLSAIAAALLLCLPSYTVTGDGLHASPPGLRTDAAAATYTTAFGFSTYIRVTTFVWYSHHHGAGALVWTLSFCSMPGIWVQRA